MNLRSPRTGISEIEGGCLHPLSSLGSTDPKCSGFSHCRVRDISFISLDAQLRV